MPAKRWTMTFGLFLLLAVSAVAAGSFEQALEQANRAIADKQWQAAAEAFGAASAVSELDAGQHYNHACVLALSGSVDRAFTALEAAVNAGYTDRAHIERDPDLAPLRADPRYAALLKHADALLKLDQRQYGAKAIETPYAETLSEAERIAGLSRLWSEAKYNFANFDLVPDLDWDALYLKTLPKVQQTPRTQDYYRELIAFLAQLQDGHTGVFPPDALAAQFYSRPPLRTRLIEGRVMVTEVLDDSLKQAGLKRGTEILAIDGLAVHDYVRQSVLPWVSASTPQDLRQRAYGFDLLLGPVDRTVKLRLGQNAHDSFEVSLRRWSPSEHVALKIPGNPAFAWKLLPGGIAYVALNHFDNSEAADQYLKQFDEIKKAKAIIFDVRRNGGGNSGEGYRILATLTDQTLATSQWQTRKYVSAWRAWGLTQAPIGETGSWPADLERRYEGKVVVLTSAQTYSAAEDFVGAFKGMKRGLVIGEATGGSTGQPLFLNLPGGGSARICSKRDRLADGTEFVGVGIHPDVTVTDSVDTFRAKRDRVLDEALLHLQENR
ncbi:MAG: hypothetical protein IPK97_16435 [Ahniella sp.]|nr:hypothetical protein [Ahniella sp.]